MIEENLPPPPAQNTLCDSHFSDATNKICHVQNKFNKNQNCLVIEIDKKLFEDKQPSMSDAEEYRDNFVRNKLQLNAHVSIVIIVTFHEFIAWLRKSIVVNAHTCVRFTIMH